MFSFFRKKSLSVGVDIVEVSRFEAYKDKKEDAFLSKVFSLTEINYCFSYSDPSSHLAGTFAAKEAVSKALGVKHFPFSEIEVRHDNDGKPEAFMKGKKLPVSISITHSNTIAAAIAAT
jgi:phosphopantetheine--protein transferase-like protein